MSPNVTLWMQIYIISFFLCPSRSNRFFLQKHKDQSNTLLQSLVVCIIWLHLNLVRLRMHEWCECIHECKSDVSLNITKKNSNVYLGIPNSNSVKNTGNASLWKLCAQISPNKQIYFQGNLTFISWIRNRKEENKSMVGGANLLRHKDQASVRFQEMFPDPYFNWHNLKQVDIYHNGDYAFTRVVPFTGQKDLYPHPSAKILFVIYKDFTRAMTHYCDIRWAYHPTAKHSTSLQLRFGMFWVCAPVAASAATTRCSARIQIQRWCHPNISRLETAMSVRTVTGLNGLLNASVECVMHPL